MLESHEWPRGLASAARGLKWASFLMGASWGDFCYHGRVNGWGKLKLNLMCLIWLNLL